MARSLTIDGQLIDDSTDCYVIAEVGHNHGGDLETCKELFRKAKEAGADAVKLQKRHNQTLFSQEAYNRPYDNRNSYGATYGEHREFLEFERPEYEELIPFCKELGIHFFSTAFDIRSADFLAELDMPAYKLASGDIRNTPLIKHVAKIGKPMVISTGAATMDDARRAYETASEFNTQVALLQCTAGYPAAFEELDVAVIATYREQFPNAVVGLSAHDNGIAMAPVAYTLGARIVEKHFTLNRAMKGTDHAFSLEPLGLQKMVRDLRRTRVAIGDGKKKIYESEEPTLVKMGKQLVATRNIAEGEKLTEENMTVRSPGGEGLMPYEYEKVLGLAVRRPLPQDAPIRREDILG